MDIDNLSISFDCNNFSRLSLLVKFLKLSLFLVIINRGHSRRNHNSEHNRRALDPCGASVIRARSADLDSDGDNTGDYQYS